MSTSTTIPAATTKDTTRSTPSSPNKRDRDTQNTIDLTNPPAKPPGAIDIPGIGNVGCCPLLILASLLAALAHELCSFQGARSHRAPPSQQSAYHQTRAWHRCSNSQSSASSPHFAADFRCCLINPEPSPPYMYDTYPPYLDQGLIQPVSTVSGPDTVDTVCIVSQCIWSEG